MLGFAKGTKNAPDGAALTGEEGAELIKSGDQAYLAGTNGPEIVHLRRYCIYSRGNERYFKEWQIS